MTQTLIKTVADFETTLATQVAAGATTATLSSITDDDGVVLANGTYGFTFDGDVADAKEYVVATLTGTALTSVTSVSRQGVATTGFANFHRRGATVSVTDWATLSRINNLLDGTTNFDAGTKLGYDAAPAGLTGNQFATVTYVLGIVSGGTVTFDQQVVSNRTAGENLTAQDHVYLKESDNRWYKVDADLTATFQQVRHGIALSTATTGNAVTIAISGQVAGFTGLSAGSKYYASNTAGAITTTPGTFTVFVGWATSTTTLLLDPYARDIPYGYQKDALVGSSGTPSSTNAYVTQLGTSDGSVDQSQTTQNSSSTFGAADTTTNRNKLAQSFVASKNLLRGVNLYKAADSGTFTGTVTVSLQADSSGSPSGVALATKTISNAFWLAYPVGDFSVLFSAEYASTPGTTYWIVLETSTADSVNHPNIGINTAGGYASGSAKFRNTTDGWTAIATIDLYFKVNQAFSGKDIVGITGAIPAQASKVLFKAGNVALNNAAVTTITHGIGKIPSVIRARYIIGDGTRGAISEGTYDIVNNAYQRSDFLYNEATSGVATYPTDGLVAVAATATAFATVITITAYDEMSITFSASSGTSSILYEVIG